MISTAILALSAEKFTYLYLFTAVIRSTGCIVNAQFMTFLYCAILCSL